VFIRALVVAFTVAALWWSSSSFGVGLGLGELKVESNLAAPLKASISLRGMEGIDLDPEQFSIRIDSDSKSKIEYRLLRMDADTAIIQLYTLEAISDPLFQFSVEVKWDSSAVMRSYDVLVDPPSYGEYFRNIDEAGVGESLATVSQPAASQPVDAPADKQNALQAQQPIALSDDSAPATAVAEEVKTGSLTAAESAGSLEPRREYGPTIDGNSIWRVARAVATDNPDLTIYQWMYAIWKDNPNAFTRNNMHRLNLEETLGIPLETEVAATPHSAAWRAYSDQMTALQVGRPGGSDDAAATAIGSVQDIFATTGVAAVDTRLPVPSTDADQSPDTAAAEVNTARFNATTALATPVVEESIIALVEESASTIDEESIVISESDASPNVDQETALVNPSRPAAPPVIASDGVSVDTVGDSNYELSEVVSPGVDLNEVTVLLDTLDSEMMVNTVATNALQNEAAVEVDAVPPEASAADIPEWSRALQKRYDYINQLPVIGSEGTLAFVGRLVQAVDRSIATSPSWATLAFGIWITLVLMMLRQELQSRRKNAAAASVSTQPVELEADAVANEKSAKQDSAQVVEEEPIDEHSPGSPMAAPARSNAPAIIAQANTIRAQGDTEEAIKLMRLAVELQPGQPTLVMHLLELYHSTRRAQLFGELIDRARPVLEALDSMDQTRLEVMHAQLCPDGIFPIGRTESFANPEIPAGDTADTESTPYPKLKSGNHAELGGTVPAGPQSGDFENSNNDGGEDGAFIETQVIFTDNGVPLREEATPMPCMVGEILDLDVTLKEADVYLAYGLYESAEELLLKGMEVDPERVDFLARLLDSYYATRNVVDFITCAEVLLDMGDAGLEYWERVEIMGYELAPYNKLFADGKDKSLTPVLLEIPKPETADFDFSDIDVSEESAFTEFEIAQDSESTFTDIKIDKYLNDNSESADLDLDLETRDIDDDSDLLLDGLTSELDELQEAGDAVMTDDEELLEIDLDATGDDFDLALPVSLEAAEDELQAVIADEVEEDDDLINLDYGAEDVMQFTMDEDIIDDDLSSGQSSLTDDNDPNLVLVDDSTADTPFGVKLDLDNSRILYFPDSSSDGKNMGEFESEVKLALQAIRDQLQNMTERLFHQERETRELHRTIAEMSDDSQQSGAGKAKKSS